MHTQFVREVPSAVQQCLTHLLLLQQRSGKVLAGAPRLQGSPPHTSMLHEYSKHHTRTVSTISAYPCFPIARDKKPAHKHSKQHTM
eukprot:1154570-Pelagomonas_calceolata.AAC.2